MTRQPRAGKNEYHGGSKHEGGHHTFIESLAKLQVPEKQCGYGGSMESVSGRGLWEPSLSSADATERWVGPPCASEPAVDCRAFAPVRPSHSAFDSVSDADHQISLIFGNCRFYPVHRSPVFSGAPLGNVICVRVFTANEAGHGDRHGGRLLLIAISSSELLELSNAEPLAGHALGAGFTVTSIGLGMIRTLAAVVLEQP